MSSILTTHRFVLVGAACPDPGVTAQTLGLLLNPGIIAPTLGLLPRPRGYCPDHRPQICCPDPGVTAQIPGLLPRLWGYCPDPGVTAVGSKPTAVTVWPSGLRRWLQAAVRKGVGSKPTAVTVWLRNVAQWIRHRPTEPKIATQVRVLVANFLVLDPWIETILCMC